MSESENFNRLVRLLARGGTMVLRKSLDKHSAPHTFAEYIYQNQMKVLKIKLFDNQRVLVVAREIDKMDITLLCKLLLELFKDNITAKEKASVAGIKTERDNIMHSEILERAAVKTETFEGKWQDITTFLQDLADEIGDAVFQEELKEFIEETKKSVPSNAEIHTILIDWCQSNKELEKKIDGLAKKVKEMQVQQASLTKKTNTRLDAFKDKFQAHYDYTTRTKLPVLQTAQKARDHLLKDFSVVIIGGPGEGKTTTAFLIIQCLVDQGDLNIDRCAILFDPDDLKDVESSEIDLLVIDDIFGKHNAEVGKYNGWSKFFSTLQTFVSNGKMRIVIASRMHIFLEYKKKLSGLEVFSRVVKLNSYDLTTDEKEQILTAQLKANDKDNDAIDIRACLTNEGTALGFPLCAHQFASDFELNLNREEYFLKPYKQYIEQNFRNLDDQSVIALLFVFYKQNNLLAKDLDITKIDKESENMLLHIGKLCGIEKHAATLIRDTKLKVNSMTESYLRNIKKSYAFLHDTFYETLALIHGEEYPSEVVKHCTIDFLCQCIHVDRTREEGVLVIEEDDFPALAERIVNEVRKEDNGYRLSTHPVLLNKEFVEELLNVVSENEDTFREFMCKNMSFMYVGNHAFLYHVISCVSNNDMFVNTVLPLLKCEHGKTDDNCWKCKVKSEALVAACETNRQDIYREIVNSECKVETLCLYKAVENLDISPDFVKKIYTDIKQANGIIPDKELLQFCLGLSIQHNDTRVFNVLKESGLKVSSEVIYYIVQTGDKSLLSSTLEDLIKEMIWKPDTMSISRAMVDALVKDRKDILEVLEKAGAKLTEFGVYWAILDHGFDAVVTVVEQLLKNDTFDVESRDLAWGLAMAIKKKQEDDRIHKRLINAGVLLTMSLMGALVEIGQSIDEIKPVVEELKHCGRWDAEDYSVAVAYMAARKRPDSTLQNFLKTEGAGITPACLNYAVIRYTDQVDFVIQTLKAADNFKPSNKYIARAFVWSMECADKTVYSKLVQEGLHLSMACLVYAVERFISIPTLENIISCLKSEKMWSANDDFALEALSVANKRQDKTAYDKLILEGITWRPRSLYVAVESETVYGLRQVINQLRERNILDGANEDIQSAMSLANTLKDKRKHLLLKEMGL